MRKAAFVGFTRAGCDLARSLARAVEVQGVADEVSVSGPVRFAREAGVEPFESLAAWASERFRSCDALVFVSACGIAVRAIAPLVADKLTDPAVVVLDERGSFCIPLLSGHVGGANDLARFLAQETGGCAVVSTATDVNGVFAIDDWTAREGFSIMERARAKEVSAALLEGAPVGLSSAFPLIGDVPAGFSLSGGAAADVGVRLDWHTGRRPFPRTLHLVPRCITLGVGCRRGVGAEVLRDQVEGVLSEARCPRAALSGIATIDVKRGEPAIDDLAARWGLDVAYFSADELRAVPGGFLSSEFVERAVGVGNVCERAATARGESLVLAKRAAQGCTVALGLARMTAAF